MNGLNYLCRHDVSDEDCYKCMKRGIVMRCPENCEYFDDRRKGMSEAQLKERAELMKKLGVKDQLPWETGDE